MNHTIYRIVALALALGLALPALANKNSRYGETGWNRLPTQGTVTKNIWVGSWWAYKWNGIAYRQNANSEYRNRKGETDAWLKTDKPAILSPSEKYDALLQRADKIGREDIKTFLDKVGEKENEITSKIEKRRELIRKLNKLIEEKREEADFDWKESDEGKEYLEINKQIEEAEAELEENRPEVDTATEHEVLHHGTGQFGVQSWWGHCNAWAASAIMDPEPRHSTTVDGIEFTAGDVKALLTESWMELQSSFYGSRNGYHKDQESRDAIDFKDVSPAAFHIFFSDQIANKDKSFVIDRFTGDEVWNQPVKAFRSSVEVLNDGEPVKRDITQTEYPGWGKPAEKKLGEKDVWEVSVTTTIHWMTDGLPHEDLTVQNIRAEDLTDSEFKSSSVVGSRYKHQIELRTLTYVLFLDKSPEDGDAQIIGDGEWKHGNTSSFTALHPDFFWQPLANVNNSRDYENEWVDYDLINERLLPGTLSPAEDPTVEPTGAFKVEGAFVIPDADKETGVTVDLVVEGAPEEMVEMEAHVVINHTYKGDLKISLEAPNGSLHNMKKFGSGGSEDNVDRVWDIKTFRGLSANGTWKLHVWDQWSDDTGDVTLLELNFK